MEEPPGDPMAAIVFPLASNTSVGAIDERGRLLGPTWLATGAPFTSGRNEKSVN